MTAWELVRALPAVMTGSSHSTGLRYVNSRITTTTASVAYSSTPSMPLNEPAWSAAIPPGPVMWIASPSWPLPVTSRIWSTSSASLFQPSLPIVIGTTTCNAFLSSDGSGPITLPVKSGDAPNARTSLCALFMSSGVIPDPRSYTTIAGIVSAVWNCFCSSTTFVDSALPGSQAEFSFFSTPVNLPASGPATPRLTSQTASTNHFVQRPQTTDATPRARLMRSPIPRTG